MKRRASPREEARRRWGRASVLAGGLAPARRARSVPRLPGTAAERRLASRILNRSLTTEALHDAIKLLRAGAKLKELEIHSRLESMLGPEIPE